MAGQARCIFEAAAREAPMLTPEMLDSQPVAGLSLGFILIFFLPLLVVAFFFLVYCGFARQSVLRKARVLTLLWLLACVPACMLILMGYAFNSSGMNPLIMIPLWIGLGLGLIWFPVLLRKVFRILPV
jgi:hypothetical protein